ncbi:MAG: hypothetical protein ACOVN5_06985 [Aquidulcibacter sp.]
MADPTKYAPGYSFSGYQATSPSKPLPAPRLDDELAKIANSISQTVDGLKDIRRSDGKLKNGIVTTEALESSLSASVAAVPGLAASAAASAASASNSAASASRDAASAAVSANAAFQNATGLVLATDADATNPAVVGKAVDPKRLDIAITAVAPVSSRQFGIIGDNTTVAGWTEFAAAVTSGKTIGFSSGVHKVQLSGAIAPTSDIRLRGISPGETILDFAGSSASTIFDLTNYPSSGSARSIIIENMTIRNFGRLIDPKGKFIGRVVFRNCRFENYTTGVLIDFLTTGYIDRYLDDDCIFFNASGARARGGIHFRGRWGAAWSFRVQMSGHEQYAWRFGSDDISTAGDCWNIAGRYDDQYNPVATPGVSNEANAICVIQGRKHVVHGCVIQNLDNASLVDAEGIYSKVQELQYTDTVCINVGRKEGAFTVKQATLNLFTGASYIPNPTKIIDNCVAIFTDGRSDSRGFSVHSSYVRVINCRADGADIGFEKSYRGVYDFVEFIGCTVDGSAKAGAVGFHIWAYGVGCRVVDPVVRGISQGRGIVVQTVDASQTEFPLAAWSAGATVSTDELRFSQTPDANITAWASGQIVSIGDLRKNGGLYYVAATAGTTGATAPAHVQGSVSDGAVTWRRTRRPIGLYRAVAGGVTGSTIPTHTSGTVSDGSVSWAFVTTDFAGSNEVRVSGADVDGIAGTPSPRGRGIHVTLNIDAPVLCHIGARRIANCSLQGMYISAQQAWIGGSIAVDEMTGNAANFGIDTNAGPQAFSLFGTVFQARGTGSISSSGTTQTISHSIPAQFTAFGDLRDVRVTARSARSVWPATWNSGSVQYAQAATGGVAEFNWMVDLTGRLLNVI